MTIDWRQHRVIWVRGGIEMGKSYALRETIHEFERDGGEALVHRAVFVGNRDFSTKLFTFAHARDTVPALDEIAAARLAGNQGTPFLLAVDDVDDLDTYHRSGELDDLLIERIAQVIRNAEALNAWVVFTSLSDGLPKFIADVLGELSEPVKRYTCYRSLDSQGDYQHAILDG